jgi:hypothetical protein
LKPKETTSTEIAVTFGTEPDLTGITESASRCAAKSLAAQELGARDQCGQETGISAAQRAIRA